MAYSNINKDKEQADRINWLKNLGIWVICILIIYSSLANIWQQWKTLQDASFRNLKLENELNSVSIQNKILLRQIEYATGSAYAERKSREYLGLGKQDDYWLKMPTNIPEVTIFPEIKVNSEIPIIIKWWNLFTHLR